MAGHAAPCPATTLHDTTPAEAPGLQTAAWTHSLAALPLRSATLPLGLTWPDRGQRGGTDRPPAPPWPAWLSPVPDGKPRPLRRWRGPPA